MSTVVKKKSIVKERKLERQNLKGIMFMLFGVCFLIGMNGCAKQLGILGYHPFQIMSVRGWGMSLCFFAFLKARKKIGCLATHHIFRHIMRSLIGMGSTMGYFFALHILPITTVAVIGFGATFVMTALSAPLFKDKVGFHRWIAVFFGFVGILIALHPGAHVSHREMIGLLSAACGMLCYSGWTLSSRWLSQSEHHEALIFYYMFVVAIITTILAPFVWHSITHQAILFFGMIIVCGFATQMCLTKAYAYAEVGAVAPFEYTSLILTAFLDFTIWKVTPSLYVWGGSAFIIASGLYIIIQEMRNRNLKDVDQSFEN